MRPLISFILLFTKVLQGVTSGDLICEIDPTYPTDWVYLPSQNVSEEPSIGIFCDVNDALTGVVRDQAKDTYWTGDASGFHGLGVATHGYLSGMGETVYINGLAVVRNTDNRSDTYYQTVTSHTFRTQFSIFVQEHAVADATYSVNVPGNFSLNQLYSYLYEKGGKFPFCYYGLGNFPQIDGIALSKAPVYQEPLFGERKQSYYSQPSFHLPNKHAFIIGCAANFSEIADPELYRLMSKLLYVNPYDKAAATGLQVHSHGVVLNRCLKRAEDIDATAVEEVFHMLSNASMGFIQGNVFVLNSPAKLFQVAPEKRNNM